MSILLSVFAITITLFATQDVAAVALETPFEGCETALVSRIRTLSPFIKPLDKASVLARALPSTNLDRPNRSVAKRLNDPFQGPVIPKRFLDSDLGPSFWSATELEEWLSLAPIMSDADLAVNELLKITEWADYCTPGLSQEICVALRHSRQVQAQLAREGHATDHAEYLERKDRAHAERGVLQFPWGDDPVHLQTIAPAHALMVMQILARETLLRHVRPELSLEARLILASFPQIIELYPVFDVFPVEFPLGFPLGGHREVGLPVSEYRIRVGNVEGRLRTNLFYEDLWSVAAAVEFSDRGGFTGTEAKRFEHHLQASLQGHAAQYALLNPSFKPLAVEMDWDEFLNVHPNLDTYAEQLLFLMYVMDQERALRSQP